MGLHKYFITQDTVFSILSLLLTHFLFVILFIGNFGLENLRKLFAKIRYEKYLVKLKSYAYVKYNINIFIIRE
jgi:hypothetical protein